ncbi:MAG: hypothetical protein KIT80_19015 [Chitinophagaceae bacterium]|nr:hypothetical protein [Chitinophagaceae bacterium]MCW5929018.1 hypothetical protein [Chitinophagaceae bacterium]
MKNYSILMADVIKSRNDTGNVLAGHLQRLTADVNSRLALDILSPFTVTLGDEFQGIPVSMQAGLQMIILMEEMLLEREIPFQLRYVLGNGPIQTPINKKVAHGMLGRGLTETREKLNALKKEDTRFLVFGTENDGYYNKLFVLYQSVKDDWNIKDSKLISDFLQYDDYKTVADKNNKTWSQMWKRKRSLKIKEYNIIKQMILDDAVVPG